MVTIRAAEGHGRGLGRPAVHILEGLRAAQDPGKRMAMPTSMAATIPSLVVPLPEGQPNSDGSWPRPPHVERPADEKGTRSASRTRHRSSIATMPTPTRDELAGPTSPRRLSCSPNGFRRSWTTAPLAARSPLTVPRTVVKDDGGDHREQRVLKLRASSGAPCSCWSRRGVHWSWRRARGTQREHVEEADRADAVTVLLRTP